MTEAAAVDATRRTRLANERTFLAWWRTSLGACGLALAVGRLLPELAASPHWPYVALGVFFAVMAAALSLVGWSRFAAVERGLTGAASVGMPPWVASVLALALTIAAGLVTLLLLL